MRGKPIMIASGAVIALGAIGHGALDALADQKVVEAMDHIRAQLPAGSELTYGAIDGDPYSTGAVIQDLRITHPTFGESHIETTTIGGVELDQQGELAAIGNLDLSNLAFNSHDDLGVSVRKANLKELSGDGLQRLLARDYSPEALTSLEFELLAAQNIDIKDPDGVASIGAVRIDNDATRRSTVELSKLSIDATSEDAQLVVDRIGWSGGFLDKDATLPSLANPEPFFALLPSTFTISGLNLTTLDGDASLTGLESSMIRSSETAVEIDYALENAAIASADLPPELGNSASMSGKTEHDLESGITKGHLNAIGDGLAVTDITFELRGVDLLSGMLAGQPTPATPEQAPAIIGASLDYRDDGFADHMLNTLAGTTPEARNDVADQLLYIARAMTGGELPDSFNTIIAEAREFIIDPQSLRIELAPNAPVDIANLTLATMMNPGGLPQLLGLSLQAND